MNKLAFIFHRIDGVLGYQTRNSEFVAILKVPKALLENVQIFYDDPYNWKPISDKNQDIAWHCENRQDYVQKESDATFDYFKFVLKSRENRFKYFFVFNYQSCLYRYSESGWSIYQNEMIFSDHSFAFTWNYSSPGKFVGPLPWWNKTTWYQIFPDRFSTDQKMLPINYQNYHQAVGGNLRGIIGQLDYIQDLGFSGIYLNPIFKARSAHKYDTIDYLEIDPDFGSLDDFKTLISELKKRNMKIMLDGVFNHVGHMHPFWQDVLAKRSKSPFLDYFVIWDVDKIGAPEQFGDNSNFYISGSDKQFGTFANTPNMPRLNWNNPEVMKYLQKIVTFWTNLGIDAWRMDVADEVSFACWRTLRQTILQINPEVMLLGEVWYDSLIFLQGDQFDSTMNYPFSQIVFEFLLEGKIDLQTFVEKMTTSKYRYSENVNAGLFNLLGSHDTPRLAWKFSKQKVKMRLAIAMLLLWQGSPSLYYGDEIELIGPHKEHNREIFINQNNHEHLTYQLVKIVLSYRTGLKDLIMNAAQLEIVNNQSLILRWSNQHHAKFDFANEKLFLDGKEVKLV